MSNVSKVLWIIIVISIILAGCGQSNNNNQNGDRDMDNKDNVLNTDIDEVKDIQEADKPKEDEDSISYEATIAFTTNLDEHEAKMFEIADGWTNGHMFDCTWRYNNIAFADGIMSLTIDSDGENAKPKWSGSEYRSREFYSYGLYEVRMKPIKNDGVVSSFFTYTGPSDDNPWDEIDIEFLGRDTTKMQLNYFTNGVGNHEYMHDLGFDAADEFHTYSFEWLPDSITWYVDGEPIHTATANIPSTPSKVMMNVWPGIGVDSWLKAFDGTVPLTAKYDWIRVTQYDIQEN